MALGTDLTISSFFKKLRSSHGSAGHVYIWVRCKVGATYTFRQFRQRILYVGKSVDITARVKAYKDCHDQHISDSKMRMLWREYSHAQKNGETIVLVRVTAIVDGMLSSNFGKDVKVLETFLMYTLGLSKLHNKIFSMSNKLCSDYATYLRDSCKIAAYVLYCTWLQCAATGSWPSSMVETINLPCTKMTF